MAAPAERNANSEPPAPAARSRELESWGLLLIPVLLCIGMLIFAVAIKAQPAPSEVPVSRTCVSPSQSGPSGDC